MIPKISTVPLLQLASGDRLSLQVYQFQGATPGKKVYLQANLHGAEISGNAVIYHLIQFLQTLDNQQLQGEIWLVPVCNPLSTNQRSHHFSSGRYNSYDGQDWNRIFWDYEKTGVDIMAFAQAHLHLEPEAIQTQYRQMIQDQFQQLLLETKASSRVPFKHYYRCQLQSLCLDADYVLDLHTSTNQALDYLYCFQGREASARDFLLDYGILMSTYDGDAFDEAFLKPWLALESCLADLGKPIQFDLESWTLELGSGMAMDEFSIALGTRGIKNYLASKGVLKVPDFPLPITTHHEIQFVSRQQVKKYHAIAGGMIQNRVELGTFVEKNQLLYEILSFNKIGKIPQILQVFAEADGLVLDLAINQAVNQFDYVLAMMELG
ncbi:MAG: succinylglutamate desuccinylase/aspartoacylase family protein [Oscillatoriales cyanobacterium SM2_3_0]|nr:succinylglutamate desuccinylase/aspartoacylase family protein [Oscillatoriales cyanobacterium SM2_3_0]